MGVELMRSLETFSGAARRRLRGISPAILLVTLMAAAPVAHAWSPASSLDEDLKLFVLKAPKTTASKVLDRHGKVIGILGEEQRMVIPYAEIPKAFVNAVVATEDAEFWTHSGVTARGALRAGWNFISSMGQRKEGFSTITMQLVKNVTEQRQKSLDRKFQEILLARKLENTFTKKQIFEMYANEVWFGGNRYGLEVAAQYYFAKRAAQLNVEECALLAGMLQNARIFDPCSRDPKTMDLVKNRRNHVLERMVAEGYLKTAEGERYKKRPVRTMRGGARAEASAPYAVEEVRKYLVAKYGHSTVQNGGLIIHTTLDGAWQQSATEAVKKGLKVVDRKRGFRRDSIQWINDPENAKLPDWNRALDCGDSVRGVVLGWRGGRAKVRFGAISLDVPESAFTWAGRGVQRTFSRGAAPLFLVKSLDSHGNPAKVELDQEPEVEGALLALDPQNGEIRAMVGGYSFKRSQYNRALQAERQVGSTMKAFVYGAALAKGMTPATLVQDVPTRYMFGAQAYEPGNYESDFWGAVPIWDAMCHSRNVAAVRTAEAVGMDGVIGFARLCGVQGELKPYPSLALGAADLSLKDMVRGYGTLANGGRQTPSPFLIRRIVGRNGKVMENYQGKTGEQVLDPMSNFQLIQCLQGVAQCGTGARSNELNWPVAGKTGTTNDHTDALFMGFSTRVVCGVWVGLDTKKPIYAGADGGKVALPIWVDFMKTALPSTTREEFPAPEGMEWAEIDKLTGLVATDATELGNRVRLAFKPGTTPAAVSTLEAIQAAKAARIVAPSLPMDQRPWGVLNARVEVP